MATIEEKSERLKRILAGIAKPEKRKLDVPTSQYTEERDADQIDEELLNKLKQAEVNFNRKKRGLKNKPQKSNQEISYEEVKEHGDGQESLRTAYLFIFTIITMIASLFCLMGVLLVSLLVYLAAEEVELLHEISGESAQIFRQELREAKVLIPFIIQVGACAGTIKLIVLESYDEVWFYIKKKMNGLNILSVAVMVQFMIFTGICYLYSISLAHKHHLVINLITLANLIALLATARSKVSDFFQTRAQYETQLSEKDSQFQQYMQTYQKLNDKMN